MSGHVQSCLDMSLDTVDTHREPVYVEAYIGFYPPLHSTPTFENIATGNVRES